MQRFSGKKIYLFIFWRRGCFGTPQWSLEATAGSVPGIKPAKHVLIQLSFLSDLPVSPYLVVCLGATFVGAQSLLLPLS